MVENSSHADISYRDMWNIPPLHFDPVHPLFSDGVATRKPKRHRTDENNDQVRRNIAKILPLKLLLNRANYLLYEATNTNRGKFGYRPVYSTNT
jgi:hypothetical protein